ncbi:MAG: UDP-glucose 4-epimerase GalE [Oscillospiraceae bacterium]
MDTILVTGGAGFIGSHTCVELQNGGYNVVIVDNFYNSKPETLEKIKDITGKQFKFYEADIRDFDAMSKVFSENKIDAVINFAGLKAVGESVEKPIMYYENNIGGILTLLRAMDKFSCRKIVFSSSATVYGMNNPVPYNETMPISATNPYGYTKVMTEQILTDISKSNPEWSVSLLRYFNPIGAHKSGLIGENPNGIPNNLLPYVAQIAAGKLEKLNVFGDDYDTPDGTGIRDYIHVVDLAKGHLCAVDYVLNHKGVEAVNLGTGKGTSVLEIVAAFEKASGKKIPYTIVPRRAGDIATCYADTEKAKKLFGWSAEFSIDEMCKDGWNFTLKNTI